MRSPVHIPADLAFSHACSEAMDRGSRWRLHRGSTGTQPGWFMVAPCTNFTNPVPAASTKPAAIPVGSRASVGGASVIDSPRWGYGSAAAGRVILFDASDSIDQLRRGIETADVALIAKTCHRLRGSCASLGATMMAELCAKLEVASISHALADEADLLQLLEIDFGTVRLALTTAFPLRISLKRYASS